MALDVTVGVKGAGFQRGLQAMRAQAGKFSGDLKGMLVGAFSIAGVVAFASRMREVRNEALRLGTSVESVQRISKVAKGADVDFEVLAKAMNKVTLEAGKAANGDKGSGGLFKRLGLDAKAFVGLKMEDKIIALSAAFQRSKQSGDGTAAMLELLGERGTEIIPVLAQGPQALASGMKEAAVQTNATVQAFATLDKTIGKLKGTGARWLSQGIGIWGKIVAEASSVLGQQDYVDAANLDLKTENMRRKHEGKKELTGDEADAWVYKRQEQLRIAARDSGQKDAEDAAGDEGAEKTSSSGFNPEAAEAEKMADLRKSIAEEEENNRAAEMSGQARINELTAQRLALDDQINDSTLAGLEAKKRALALDHEITQAYHEQNKAIDAAAKKQEDALEKRYLAKASPEEKKKYLTDKQDRLRKEASDIDDAGGYQQKLDQANGLEAQAVVEEANGKDGSAGALREQSNKLRMQAADDQAKFDPAKAAEKRAEADGLQDDIDDGGKGKGRIKVAVGDSLQRAGGGGGHTSGLGLDQGVRQRDKAIQLLQQLVELQRGTVTVRDAY